MAKYLLKAPLRILLSKTKKSKSKYFSLNLNTYRNAHYFILNNSKKLFKEELKSQIELLPVLFKIEITYILYVPTKRKLDISNICSIVDKYFLDALVELGKIPDDNYDFVPKVTYLYGGYIKNRGRVDIIISTLP